LIRRCENSPYSSGETIAASTAVEIEVAGDDELDVEHLLGGAGHRGAGLATAVADRALQRALRAGRQIAHVLDEQRAAARRAQGATGALAGIGIARAATARAGARGRVLERGAHRDEPAGAARTAAVKHARHELAPGAMLAADQHRRVTVGILLDGGDHRTHSRARGDQKVVRLQCGS
jgi:predicted GNAT family acetyltransferase